MSDTAVPENDYEQAPKIVVSVAPELRDALRQAAGAEKKLVSEWVRERLRIALNGEYPCPECGELLVCGDDDCAFNEEEEPEEEAD